MIPAYDCADTIGATVRAFKGIGNVIVVGSTGSTGDKALLAGATVVGGKGLGKGESVSLGLRYVESDRVILCDGDIRGFEPAHALAMAEPSDAMLRGRITGLFKMKFGSAIASHASTVSHGGQRAADLARTRYRANRPGAITSN